MWASFFQAENKVSTTTLFYDRNTSLKKQNGIAERKVGQERKRVEAPNFAANLMCPSHRHHSKRAAGAGESGPSPALESDASSSHFLCGPRQVI